MAHINTLLTDEAILAELGSRAAQARLNLSMTQAELADEAGIGKRTLEKFEAGSPTQLVTLVRVLRALDLVDNLETLIPPPRPSPMALLRGQGRTRKRAPKRSLQKKPEADRPWHWNDDEDMSR